ncbi:helix-turn-helix transcriptional regulator [Ferrimonas sp. YFM]|uniref:helix-turn-helix transcriptional regulator n=1 Tax=Ferrimonas sp. YFM TaxID=3028878 RepID=UPI0025739403|nr:helix-turn-helix transcriptional regulator [Ferrimonas sp. YFM]BDY05587.1 hypothetical protein F0521_26280 [Ferrimonas sp. YFM]
MKSELIRMIYQAVEEPHLWTEVLKGVAGFSESNHCFLLAREGLHSQPLGFYDYGFDEHYFERYNQYFYQVDVWSQALLPHAPGQFHASHWVYEDNLFLNSEIYNDFARPSKIRHSIGCLITHSDGLITELGFMRSQDQSHYTDEQVKTSNLFVPHIEQAITMARRREFLETQRAQLIGLFDSSSIPTFICTQGGKLLYRNHQAEQFAQGAGVLAGRESEFRFAETDHQLTFNRLRHESMQFIDGQGSESPGRELLTWPGGRVWLHVRPWNWSTDGIWGEQSGCALLVTFEPCSGGRVPQIEWIAELFSLTQAEAGICRSLCSGMTSEQIAVARGVSVKTVRQQIKSCLKKTGTSSQVQLVSTMLLASMEPNRAY